MANKIANNLEPKDSYDEPVYPIGIASKLLEVCLDTLRIWEKKGLIKPKRLGKNRYYSQSDMDKLKYIKSLIQEKKINIEGVKAMLTTTMCWDIKKCHLKERKVCPVYIKYKKDK